MIKLMILAYNLIALVPVTHIVKKDCRRELIAFCVFYAMSFTLSLLYVLDINMPSPVRGLKYVVEDIFHLKY